MSNLWFDKLRMFVGVFCLISGLICYRGSLAVLCLISGLISYVGS